MNLQTNLTGLTTAEVQERIEQGQTNVQPNKLTKPTKNIIFENLFNLFNLFNLVIAFALFSVQAYLDMFFFAIITLNSFIGIFQELRSKYALEKLSLLAQQSIQVLRDGTLSEQYIKDIVIDDIIYLQAGDQIPSDGIIVQESVEVNEALITGEPDALIKGPQSEVLSGSFVVSGAAYMKVIHVGSDNYTSKITAEAKKYKRSNSELMNDLNKIIRFSTYFIIPFGILLFLRTYYFAHVSYRDTVITVSTALTGMMPKGIVLLTTASLVIGVFKLTLKKTMVQELYSVETLARVDTICFDKTGTLTEGNMQVHSFIPMNESQYPLQDLMGSYLQYSPDNNATMQAVRKYYTPNALYTLEHVSPFSSTRKYGNVALKDVGTIFLGAYDVLLPNYEDAIKPLILDYEDKGMRLLLIAYSPQITKELTSDLVPLGILVLQDPLRKNSRKVIEYFSSQNVAMKVISGDAASTVSSIALAAGVPQAHQFIDVLHLSDDELFEIAEQYTVFGRVLPNQKKTLIKALKRKGHTVAMTGDGVNDVLALKEADCSIAMGTGSNAASQISQVILLNSDFSSVPAILGEGRRVVNNIQNTASLFLVHAMYAFLLTAAAIIFGFGFPFSPIQMTLLSNFVEGFPAFLLNIEPNDHQLKGQFLMNVLGNGLPTAILITVFIVLIQYLFGPWLQLDAAQVITLQYYVLGFTWLMQLFYIMKPYTIWHITLWVISIGGFFVSSLLLHSFVSLTDMSLNMWLVLLGFAVITYPLQLYIKKYSDPFVAFLLKKIHLKPRKPKQT